MRRFVQFSAAVLLMSGCQPPAGGDDSKTFDKDPAAGKSCVETGYLATELFGAVNAAIDWTVPGLECEGMPRPAGHGARLRFAGDLDAGHRLAFIIGLPGLEAGQTGKELQSNVTLIEEGTGRFFNTAENDICWTDVSDLDRIDDSAARFSITGNLYCVAPLTEVNGDSEITIRDLRFRGLLDWDAS